MKGEHKLWHLPVCLPGENSSSFPVIWQGSRAIFPSSCPFKLCLFLDALGQMNWLVVLSTILPTAIYSMEDGGSFCHHVSTSLAVLFSVVYLLLCRNHSARPQIFRRNSIIGCRLGVSMKEVSSVSFYITILGILSVLDSFCFFS